MTDAEKWIERLTLMGRSSIVEISPAECLELRDVLKALIPGPPVLPPAEPCKHLVTDWKRDAASGNYCGRCGQVGRGWPPDFTPKGGTK